MKFKKGVSVCLVAMMVFSIFLVLMSMPNSLIVQSASASIYYDSGNKIIYIDGSNETISELNTAIGDPTVMWEVSSKVWQVNASIQVNNSANSIFYIHYSDCETLRLLSNETQVSYIHLKGASGETRLYIIGVNITSWNSTAGAYDSNINDERSYIYSDGVNTGNLNVNFKDSVFKHLGSAISGDKQGVSLSNYRSIMIENCVFDDLYGYFYLYTSQRVTAYVRNSNFNDTGIYGYFFYADLDINNCVITNNTNYYGIKTSSTAAGNLHNVTIENTTIDNCEYGIIISYSTGTNIVRNCNISNISKIGCHGNYLTLSNTNIFNCTDSSTTTGGLGYVKQVDNCNFYNNRHGCFVSTNEYGMNIENCSFYNNDMGFLSEGNPTNITIKNSKFYNNSGKDEHQHGLGIDFAGSIKNCVVNNCTIYNHTEYWAMGIRLVDYANNITIKNSHIYNNYYGVSANDYHPPDQWHCDNLTFCNNDLTGNNYSYYLDKSAKTDLHSQNLIFYDNNTWDTIKIESGFNGSNIQYRSTSQSPFDRVNYSYIDVDGSYILLEHFAGQILNMENFTQQTHLQVKPTTDVVNITINTFDLSDKNSYGATITSFTVNTTNGNTVIFIIDGLTPNRQYIVYRDGGFYKTLTANGQGVISFSNSEWSTHSFSIFTSLFYDDDDDDLPSPTPEIITTHRDNIFYFDVQWFDLWGVPNFRWDFGDGSGSNSSGVHIYQEDGVYIVSLWILGNDGNWTRIDREITVGQVDDATDSYSLRHPFIANGNLYIPFKPDYIVKIPYVAFILCGVIMGLSYAFDIKTPINDKVKIWLSVLLILAGIWISFGVSFP